MPGSGVASARDMPTAAREQAKREARRSEPMSVSGYPYGRGGRPATASTVSSHAGAENMAPTGATTARRSGLMGVKGNGLRPGFRGSANLTSSGSGVGPSPRQNRLTGALGDITNVVHAAGRLQNKLKPQQQQQQQQQPPQQNMALAPRSPQQPPRVATAGAGAAGQANPSHALAALPRRAGEHGDETAFNAAFQNDSQDTQKVSDYATDVHAQLFEDECLLMPRADYMLGQADINEKMRGILVDWLVEVHMKYRLRSESLFLTINLIDRYLSVRTVMRKKLQLLGVTCMLIATKFEEIDPPKVHEFAYITDNTYTKSDILSMECTVLVALDFKIVVPTPAHFVDRLTRANGGDLVHRHLVQYLLELGLLDLKAIRFPASLLVSAAIMLANEFLGLQNVWPAAMVHHGRRPAGAIAGCAEELRALFEAVPRSTLQAVKRKYQLDTYSAVAHLNFGTSARPRE